MQDAPNGDVAMELCRDLAQWRELCHTHRLRIARDYSNPGHGEHSFLAYNKRWKFGDEDKNK